MTVEPLEDRKLMSVVLPGGIVGLPGTTAAAQPALAGVVVRDALLAFSVSDPGGNVIFKGHLQDRVVKENVAGTLDFYQTIRADAGFPLVAFLNTVSRSSFGGVSTDVNYRTDGIGDPTIKPERATRSVDGKTLQYVFGSDQIDPGDISLFYFAKTNATSFDLNGSTALNFGQGPVPGSGAGSVKLTTAEPVLTTQPPPTGKLAGIKFNDLNADGKRELGEPGIPNFRIYLDANNNGAFNASEPITTTDEAGQYSFAGLAGGVYHVRELQQPGYRQTAPAAGAYNVVLPAGGSIGGLDFGNTRTVKISGTVFNDANKDGVQNFGEGGLSGFTVYLDANNNGTLDAGEKKVVTGTSGAYVFDALQGGGVYHVRTAPKLFYSQTAPAGGVYNLLLPSGSVAANRNFGEKFNPIIFPVPSPLPGTVALP